MNAPLHREMPEGALDSTRVLSDVTQAWDSSILSALKKYIEIPAKSPMFDADWAAHGHIEAVLRNAADWVQAQKVEGLKLEVIRLPGRTPVLFFEVDATRAAGEGSAQTVLMYGHLDKQPEFNGWRSDLGPWTPVYEDGKLYGRGGADDGYAVYASIAAIQALKNQKTPHPRIVGLIETCEESGSYDLLPYVDALRARLGDVGLVICLDSGAGNYDQLWLTTSLRGMASGTLKVEILTEGIHSGDASGLVPSSFRIMRMVLDRLEDSSTGRLLPASFHCEVPPERLAQARARPSARERRRVGARGFDAGVMAILRVRGNEGTSLARLPEAGGHPVGAEVAPAVGAVVGDVIAILDDHQFHGAAGFVGHALCIGPGHQPVLSSSDQKQGACDLLCHTVFKGQS